MFTKIASNSIKYTFLSLVTLLQSSCENKDIPYYPPPPSGSVNTSFYLTTPSKSSLVALQTNGILPYSDNTNFTINVSDGTSYQTMDGFGFTLTASVS